MPHGQMPHAALLTVFTILVAPAASLSLGTTPRPACTPRAASIRMGGPSGLPRMPIAGWKHTKPFNPSMQYEERIATLYRDLEITLGTTDKPNERLALAAVKRLPDLINPAASSRWVFFRTKDLLVNKLGSEQAAIQLMLSLIHI